MEMGEMADGGRGRGGGERWRKRCEEGVSEVRLAGASDWLELLTADPAEASDLVNSFDMQ